jgi:murein DD-endopeptidase MepM/ murein hydrolase activator NlpD
VRYFLKNFRKVYNADNPFGAFPLWEYYPKTGTHVGTDFKIAVGTPIFAPANGEMFKVWFDKYKGNVGVYIFDYRKTTWGLELCHLKELPAVGKFKEGEIIAYSGNTGASTTGAHLHAVLHRGAEVAENYQELQSREDFLRLEKEGAIVDCFQWFCSKMKRKTKREKKSKAL